MNACFYCGVDVGSSYSKAVLLDASGGFAAGAIRRTGLDFARVAMELHQDLLVAVPDARDNVARTVATGYGRDNVAFATSRITEVSCQAAACWHLFHQALTAIDVGGQDTKIIVLGETGRRTDFRMNRRCASGTGAFLEEMAARLDTTPDGLEALAGRGRDAVPLSSFCTVFAKGELLSLIRAGRPVEDIALGVYDAVVRRVVEMASLQSGTIVLTGGAARPGGVLVGRFEAALGRQVLVPDRPQLTVALGAALLAMREGEGVP